MTRLRDEVTYRRLAYVLSATALGPLWFVALVTTWSLCLGVLVTPLGILVALALSLMTRAFAAVEAELARSLLGVAAAPPPAPPAEGRFWARLRARFGAGFWRAQAFLMLRWFVGFPVGVAVLSLLAAAVGMIFAPLWVPFVHGGVQLGFWRPHTFLQSLPLVPLGLLLLPATILAANPLGWMSGVAAMGLLSPQGGLVSAPPGGLVSPQGGLVSAPGGLVSASGGAGPSASPPTQAWLAGQQASVSPRRALQIHAVIDGLVLFILLLIWALTSLQYFWPVWVALPLGLALAIHGWFVLLAERDLVTRRFQDSPALAGAVGVAGAFTLFFICIWAVSGHGYFWPVWPMLAMATLLAAIAAAAMLGSPGRAELTERIETLETSRAGAVDLQDTELRRIERDLHDGAQARLVALGMSLGMAEQKLATEPERVGELLAEARAGAEHALRELRDLARGIHPPVLADRGLEAALASLASSTPMPVDVDVRLPRRPAPPVETAAYFVAAEALTNAAKHARANHVEISIHERGRDLVIIVRDDGRGGADPQGNGLRGMRRRVEALDGTLSVSSPRGGPTTVRAELPCG